MMMMTSSDRIIYVEIDGIQYRAEGLVLRPAGRDEALMHRLDGIETRLDRIEARLGAVEQDITIIKHDQQTLQHSVYWVLGAVGVFLAAMALRPSRGTPKEDKPVPAPYIIQVPAYIPPSHDREEKSA